MPTNIYKPITDLISGETFRCISSDEKAFVMEWTVQPHGYVPFEHIHLNQDEIFEIQEGEMNVLIDGKEYIGRAGDTIVVPKGKASCQK